MQNPKMEFHLKGFHEVTGFRVFVFEGVGPDWTRTLFTVGADLALTRRYGIRLQELPLLCLRVLQQGHDEGQTRAFAYTEAEMRLHADYAAEREEAAKNRKQRRRPHPDQAAGTAFGASAP